MRRTGILLLALVAAAATAFMAAPALGGGEDTVFAVAARAAGGRDAAAAASVASTKGVQITPDQKLILVSKDVGSERWSIALNPDDTVTGNVFLCDGGGPAFVWCQKIDDDHNADFSKRVIAWKCSGAGTCPASPCGAAAQWPTIADRVELTGAFFLP